MLTQHHDKLIEHLCKLGCKESRRSNDTRLVLDRPEGKSYFIHRHSLRVLIGKSKKDVQQIPQQRIDKFMQFMEIIK